MLVLAAIDCPHCGTRVVPAGKRPEACPTCGCAFGELEAD